MFLAIPALVYATGGTFDQRCAKAYPRDAAAQERCMMRLNEGGPVYEQNVAYRP